MWRLSTLFPVVAGVPMDRKAEDGVIDDKYPLQQTPSASYAQRNQWNVSDSDGTLILTIGSLSGGTALTRMFTERCKQPLCGR